MRSPLTCLRVLRGFLALALLLLLPATNLSCGGGGGGSTPDPVVTAPAISTHPVPQTVTAGQPAGFSVVATGTSLAYQWKKDGANIGGNSATFSITSAQASDAGSYTVVVSNSAGSVTSNAAALTVNPAVVAPAITTQPVAQVVTAGQPAGFSVVASGTAPLSYQWKKDGVNVGTNSASLTIASAQASDAGSYAVVVSNSAGDAPSNTVTLTVNAASVAITAHPSNASAVVPDTATFSVTATGSGLSYQWKKDGVAIPSATSATYTTPATSLDPMHPSGTYTYTVAVTSGGSTVTSNGAVLTVQQPDPTYAGDPVTVPTRVIPVWEYVTAYSTRGAFRLGYDEALMDPIWTSYCTYKLDPPSLEQGSRTFRPDPRSSAAVADSDYSGSGWTRGHQVMMSDMELRYGGQAGTDTCFTTNIAPQKDTHNNNIWNSFEQAISGSYNSGSSSWSNAGMVGATNRIWVSTGPTFAASPARTAGKGIAIPNGFWKVLVKEVGGVPKALAVLTPHEPVPPTADLWKYVTTIQRIETLTGLNLFPNLPANAPADFKTAADVRGWGSVFENTSGPNAHIILPEWDTTVVAGNSVTFTGHGTSTGTVASATWTFSDGQATTASNSVTRAFATAGTYTATYTVVDGSAVSKAISRQIVVTSSNANPTITAIAAQSTAVDTAKAVAFTVADDSTPVASLTFALSSDNTTLVPNANLVLTGPDTNGLCSLQITPASAQTGTANITIQVTDGGGASASRSFSFTVGSGGSAALIISQYYEGTSNNKWIEITNVGSAAYDASVSQLYLGQWNVGSTGTTAGYRVVAIPGTIGPGQTILFKNNASALPLAANIRAGVTTYNNTTTIDPLMQFNGNDPMFISPVGTADVAAWNARTDAIGDASWLTAAPFAAQDRSYYRNAAVKAPRPDYQTSEWTQKTNAEVDGAANGTTEQLGFHVVNP